MESNENNNCDSVSGETATGNDDANAQPTTSSSTSPKRCKLDPNIASTSNQSEYNANENKTRPEVGGEDETAAESNDDQTNKSSPGRFAKRNYRKRSDSQSSMSSVPMEEVAAAATTPEQTDANEASANTREESPEAADEYMSILADDSSIDSDQDDSDDESSTTSDSSDSTVNEQKAQSVLNKPKPKCDLNLVQNLIYRQSGILYKGDRRIYDTFSTGLTQRINSSIYSVERMQLLHKLEKHHGCVNCLNFNKAGNLLVTGSDDLKVVVWNWAKQQPIKVQTSGHRSNVFQSKFVDNGSANNQTDFSLITSARDGEVRHIQIAPDGSAHDRLITRHTHHAVHKIAIPDSNQNEVLTAGEDGCVMRSDLRDNRATEKLIQLQTYRPILLYSVAHHPFDPEFCVCGRDNFVRVYDKRNVKECSNIFCPEHILKQSGSNTNITCALYNHNGTEIIASYGDENIYLFDTSVHIPGTYKHTYYGHKNHQTIKGVNFFGPSSDFIMSGSDCGNIFIWDKNSEAIVQWLTGDESGVVNCLEGHPNFPIIASSGLDHDVKIWSPTNPDGRPSQTDLKKCIKENLNCPQGNFVSTYVRSIARLVNGRFHRADRSSSDDHTSDSDDDDDEDDLRSFRPCEVQ